MWQRKSPLGLAGIKRLGARLCRPRPAAAQRLASERPGGTNAFLSCTALRLVEDDTAAPRHYALRSAGNFQAHASAHTVTAHQISTAGFRVEWTCVSALLGKPFKPVLIKCGVARAGNEKPSFIAITRAAAGDEVMVGKTIAV